MSAPTASRRLLDDCFLHDRDRMRHDEVLALLDQRLRPIVASETVPLDRAAGRFLAGPVVAPRNVPLHDNAAVDGYAFAFADYAHRATLGVGPRIAAGDLEPRSLGKGEAARIFTGAVMPDGGDTVAMQEDCEIGFDGATVTVPKGLKPGANRRRAGEDVKAGETVIREGTRLRPQDIAAIASLGEAHVDVCAPLRVAIVSTGNELLDPSDTRPFSAGNVYDSNRAMLKALAALLPVEIADCGIAPDDPARVEALLLQTAAENDVVLTTGGASRGEEDHLVETLDRIGKRHLWQIAVKPGRPMTLGQISDGTRDCVVFGLPGNPVAVFVCFLLYVRPALIRLGGGIAAVPPRFPLPAGFQIARKKKDRREFLRGWLETDGRGQTIVRKFERDGSGLITGLRQATGLIELPEEVDKVVPGQTIAFIPFSSLGIDP
jgi:molybdopterin molybdotransferase